MGQSLQKITPGSETKMVKLLVNTSETYYDERLSGTKELTSEEFYRAVCETVEEINRKLGNTQFRVPQEETLKRAFDNHHKGKDGLTKPEFQKILQEVIFDTGFTGIGAKDILLFIFGGPATALLVKQGLMPKAIPNAIFIPAVTSATVFLLSKMNKL